MVEKIIFERMRSNITKAVNQSIEQAAYGAQQGIGRIVLGALIALLGMRLMKSLIE